MTPLESAGAWKWGLCESANCHLIGEKGGKDRRPAFPSIWEAGHVSLTLSPCPLNHDTLKKERKKTLGKNERKKGRENLRLNNIISQEAFWGGGPESYTAIFGAIFTLQQACPIMIQDDLPFWVRWYESRFGTVCPFKKKKRWEREKELAKLAQCK